MTIEVTILLSALSVSFGLFFGLSNLNRNKKADTKKDASEMTTVIVKLENIGTSITRLDSKMDRFEVDRKEDRERIIKLEESLKSAWIRIDEMLIEKKG